MNTRLLTTLPNDVCAFVGIARENFRQHCRDCTAAPFQNPTASDEFRPQHLFEKRPISAILHERGFEQERDIRWSKK